MTIGGALRTAMQQLADSTSTPRLDAEVLLAHVLQTDRWHLLTHPEQSLRPSQQKKFFVFIAHRCRHQPLPYIIGQTEFFGNFFRVNDNVLIPRPFTELLIESFLAHIPQHTPTMIADIGTGSGAIAITIARQRSRAIVIASDISPAALRVARKNAQLAKLQTPIVFRTGSLLEPFRHQLQPHYVIANLPYLTTSQLREPSIRTEPRLALYGGRGGMRYITALLKQAAQIPSIKVIALELDPTQVQRTRRLLRQWLPTCVIETVSDGRKIRGIIAYT